MNPAQDQATSNAHSATLESLPWLACGTLDDTQAALARQHLQDCASCRAWLAFDQTIAQALGDDRTVDYAPHAAYARFASSLDALEARRERWQRWRRLLLLPLRALPARPIHLLVAAQTAAIVLLGLGLMMRQNEIPAVNEYRTLSQPGPETGTGTLLRVVVDDAMSARELRELLQGIDGSIVSGPTELGVLTIEIDSSSAATDRDPLTLAIWLRDQPHVRFAEPVARANP